MNHVNVKALFLWLLLLFCGFFTNAQTNEIANGYDLIKLMHAKHSVIWYKNLTFKQEVFRVQDDSITSREVWLMAYSSPSMLNIRYVDFDSGRGWLIANDTIYTYNNFTLIGSRQRMHELMILGLDVYAISPDLSIERIKKIGVDLNILKLVTINGKKVYQVGKPDEICFWVCADDLLFYGMRKTIENGDIKETYFEMYNTIYGKPVATEVKYFLNGKLFILEKYSEIRIPTYLHSDLFVPANFTKVMW